MLLPFGSKVRYVPQLSSSIKKLKPGEKTKVGIYLDDLHHAGGRVGPDSHEVSLYQLEGLNYKTGRRPDGHPPAVERADGNEIRCNQLDPAGAVFPEKGDECIFPMMGACDGAKNTVQSVNLGTESKDG